MVAIACIVRQHFTKTFVNKARDRLMEITLKKPLVSLDLREYFLKRQLLLPFYSVLLDTDINDISIRLQKISKIAIIKISLGKFEINLTRGKNHTKPIDVDRLTNSSVESVIDFVIVIAR